MKNLDKLMNQIDAQVEKRIAPRWLFVQKHFVVFSVTLLSLLLAVFFFRVFYSRSYVMVSVLKEDLTNIEKILGQIDKDCNILSIRSGRAAIDFLTVEKFAGSTVGCINLAYPKRWKGAYVQQNPSVQSRPYEIFHVRDGYFVLPGYGVTLPNGLVMGKDIIISSTSQISMMLQTGGTLNYKGQALGFRIKFKIGDWDSPRRFDKETIDKINDFLKEFNEALPYAQHSSPDAVISA
jgi:hypothetical protein